jgi:chromosome segregation protein
VTAVYLKSLTIKGFKSFADPATLHFEPGITVVVGPNGSGKSNVVDAVAWVLGAQGPRTVRSSKMEDVIFAGSADRPALGRAEVSLTIDNRAGRLPGGLAEITITRTLFRNGDSEYALNGQPCRLLDVQELLSDSGVGRQQHVIISQGQLDQILQARPEDRRTVIEEAAGVLKHRRRRERAERRLAATEENLERLGDLVREVRRQMRPLERQASATRAHAALSAERRALRLFLAGTDLAGLEDRLDAARRRHRELAQVELDLRDRLAASETAVEAAAAELTGADDEERLQAVVSRVGELLSRARGLGAVLAERQRSVRRALEDAVDVDVVATLEAEAARLTAELRRTDEEIAALAPEQDRVEAAEAALRTGDDHADAAEVERLREAGAVHARARGELEPRRRGLERERAALGRIASQVEAAERRSTELAAEAEQVAAALAEAEAEVPVAEAAAAEAADAAQEAEGAAAAAEAAAHQAQRDRHRAEARAEALARAVDEARGAAGLDAVAGITDVIGLLGDVVSVDDGWRLAFEAAAGAALAGLTVSSVDAARAALRRLHETGAAGTVLVPGSTAGSPALPATIGTGGPAGGRAEAVRPHVRGRTPAVDRVLDDLVGTAVAVTGGWQEAVDLAVDRPDLLVVTRDGGRFAGGAWRLRAETVVTAAAAEEARQDARRAEAVADAAEVAWQQARAAAAEAAERARHASLAASRAEDRRQSLAGERDRIARQLAGAGRELDDARRQYDEAVERVSRDEAALAALEGRLPALEAEAEAAADRLAAIAAERRRLEAARAEAADLRRQLDVRAAGLAERRTVLVDRLADVERRLEGHVAERARAEARRRQLESEATAVRRLAQVVGTVEAGLAERLGRAEADRDAERARRRHGGARLDELRRSQHELQQRLDAVRRQLGSLEVETAEAETRRDGIVDSLARELGVGVDEARGAAAPDLPDGVGAKERLAAVEAELASLGPVNPLALDELAELEERAALLDQQVADVKQARAELRQVIRAVDDEVVRLFVDAYHDVNEHFQALIGTLFPGGSGRLTLTEPDDPLRTGVEVEARPAGKNVRKLTLLSGGERSLVALAFLFAVFRSRPSPFYLMDEVEAALDDVNLHRFLALLHEFRGEAQLIVVSHQKRTMESADALYGVTMQAGGSSKVVSQKVRRDLEPSTAPPSTAVPPTSSAPGAGPAGGAPAVSASAGQNPGER